MRWFATSALCRILGHKWSPWQRQQSWDGNSTFMHRRCLRRGCLATEQKRDGSDSKEATKRAGNTG